MNRNERILLGIGCLLCAAVFLALSFSGKEPVKITPEQVALQESVENAEEQIVFDLNRITNDQLCLLPGIGETLAERILEYRWVHGRFESLEELLKIEGISEKKLDAIRDRLLIG